MKTENAPTENVNVIELLANADTSSMLKSDLIELVEVLKNQVPSAIKEAEASASADLKPTRLNDGSNKVNVSELNATLNRWNGKAGNVPGLSRSVNGKLVFMERDIAPLRKSEAIPDTDAAAYRHLTRLRAAVDYFTSPAAMK